MNLRHALRRRALVPAALLSILLLPAAATAETVFVEQDKARLGFGGARLEMGFADPIDASAALLAGVHVDMGSVFLTSLKVGLGLRTWGSSLDRGRFDREIDGDLRDIGLHVPVSYGFFALRGARPYVMAGPALHFVSADVPSDAGLEDALSGTRLGFDLGVGLATTRDGVGVRFEARREFVEDAGGWTYALGVGWWGSGR